MRILTLNVGAAKAVLAEYQVGGKGAPTLTAYGMGDLPSVDVESAGSVQATLTPVLRELMRAHGIKPAPLVMSLSGRMVFQRFWRADSGRDRESGGLGIGLTVVKEIVDRHNGWVQVEGRKGEGACFTIHIPLYVEREQRRKSGRPNTGRIPRVN